MSENKKKNSLIKPERPGGFLDFLPADYIGREKIINTVKKIFASFGFNPIETPRIEFLKTLSGEESDTGKNIFLINSDGDKEKLAMPFDHTVPFARLLAANPYNAKKKTGIQLPWRRMVVGPVFRGESPQAGRYRQFWQADIDIAGTKSMIADAEVISVIYRVMKELGIKDFVIKINNRKILNGLAQLVDIKDRGQARAGEITKEMMRIMDKLDKIGIKGVVKELAKKVKNNQDTAPALSEQAIRQIELYLQIKGTNKEKLTKCRDIFKDVEIAKEGIDELAQILDFLDLMQISEKFIKIDFEIARGLDYYTGPVMETVIKGAEEYGSVFSGGRYNNLVKRFTDKELPATGASLGVDRLFAALQSMGIIKCDKVSLSEVMVLRLDPKKDKEYIEIANEIRSLGLNVEISLLDDTTFKGQFSYAVSRGVKYLVICGEDEFEKGTIQIKNLETRKQEELKIDKLKNFFR